MIPLTPKYPPFPAAPLSNFRFGRDRFEEATKISRKTELTQIDWNSFKYMAFDIPNHKGVYSERYAILGKFRKHAHPQYLFPRALPHHMPLPPPPPPFILPSPSPHLTSPHLTSRSSLSLLSPHPSLLPAFFQRSLFLLYRLHSIQLLQKKRSRRPKHHF